MKIKKLCSMLLVAAMTCSLFVTPVYATPSEDKQKAMEEQEALENQKAAAASERAALQEQFSTIMTKINELQIQLMEKGQEIVQAEEDLKVAEEKEQEQYEAMKLRMKYMYEKDDSSELQSVLASGTFSEMLAQAEYIQQVHEYDRDQLQEYAETVEEVKELKATLESEMENLEEMESEYQTQSDELNTMIATKSAEIDDLDVLIQEAAQAVAEAAEREEAARLAAIAAEAERQAQLAQQQQQQQQTTGNSGGSTANNTETSTPEDNNTSNESSTESSTTTTPEPSYSVSTGNAIVDRAYSWVGNAEYVWGGCAPGAFDCSGFVSYCLTGAYSRLGTTYTFLGWPRVSNPQPGDVCVNAGHCGIYIGGGQMIHAATYGVGVIVGPVQAGMVYVRW